jgi:hypothetical protein
MERPPTTVEILLTEIVRRLAARPAPEYTDGLMAYLDRTVGAIPPGASLKDKINHPRMERFNEIFDRLHHSYSNSRMVQAQLVPAEYFQPAVLMRPLKLAVYHDRETDLFMADLAPETRRAMPAYKEWTCHRFITSEGSAEPAVRQLSHRISQDFWYVQLREEFCLNKGITPQKKVLQEFKKFVAHDGYRMAA